MKLEETPSGKFRCWLNSEEEELLANYYQEDIEKEIAILLMLEGGLRSDEVLRVCARDLERSEAGFWWLKITKSKTSYRETIIPESLASKIRTMHNALGLKKGEPIISVDTAVLKSSVADSFLPAIAQYRRTT